MGFCVWNTYLALLGFTQYDPFQLRYILTGVLYLIVLLGLLGVIATILFLVDLLFEKSSFEDKCRQIVTSKSIWVLIGLPLILLLAIFLPFIPSYYGGGEPRTISLIAEPEFIDFIEELEVPSFYSKQTDLLCLLYENDNVVIIMLAGRLLEIDKSNLIGKSSIPSVESRQLRSYCSHYVLNHLSSSRTAALPPQF